MLKPLAVLIGASTLALAANAAPNSNLDASPPPSAPQTQPAPAAQPVPGPAYEQPAAPEATADQPAPVPTASPAVVAATPAPPQHDWWLLVPLWLTAIFTGCMLVFVARLHVIADRFVQVTEVALRRD